MSTCAECGNALAHQIDCRTGDSLDAPEEQQAAVRATAEFVRRHPPAFTTTDICPHGASGGKTSLPLDNPVIPGVWVANTEGEFDHWLTTVKAAVWKEGHEAGYEHRLFEERGGTKFPEGNPYRRKR